MKQVKMHKRNSKANIAKLEEQECLQKNQKNLMIQECMHFVSCLQYLKNSEIIKKYKISGTFIRNKIANAKRINKLIMNEKISNMLSKRDLI